MASGCLACQGPGTLVQGAPHDQHCGTRSVATRIAAATSQSYDAMARSCHLVAAARRNLVQAERLHIDARAPRGHGRPPVPEPIGGFHVEGLLDGQPMTAVLVDGGLECTPELLARAEIVVSLGETFGGDDVPYVAASLTDGPTAMLLTVLRAFSVVHSVAIMPGTPASGEPS